MRLRFAFPFAIGAAFFCSAAAQAADDTRYISITGSNANACTLAAPCRTLHKGISATPAGGELQILDSGFYGSNATVNKSMTISGNGHTVYLGVPIRVDGAAAVVALRGFTLNGQGAVVNGILIAAAAAVHIERCVIHSFNSIGITIFSMATGVELFVRDSTVRNNSTSGLVAGAGSLTVDNSRFYNNSVDGLLTQASHTTITRSTAAGNGTGFAVGSGGTMTLESSAAVGNGTGLSVSPAGTALLSNSTITGNASNAINNQGVLESRQNNTVVGTTFGNAKVDIVAF